LLLDAARLEGQRAGLDREGELVVVAVDDVAAYRLFGVGDLELARASARNPEARGTCR
jgi:hypothetical protein